MADKNLDPETVNRMWHEHLTTGNFPRYLGPMDFREFRRVMKLLPRNPRCTICDAPFSGIGGRIIKATLGRERSTLNPTMCNICEQFAREHHGGAEVELSMLFADVRGSTALAEKVAPLEFSRLIDRFYCTTTDILIEHNAWIEKLIGDEVTGLFVPGFAGPQHARRAVDAARAILEATGNGDGRDVPGGPWIPVGVGVHIGTAYVGAVGQEGGMTEITALGDAVNTAARLAASAGPGEALVSEQSWAAAGLEAAGEERRSLMLKGRSEAVEVTVVKVERVEK